MPESQFFSALVIECICEIFDLFKISIFHTDANIPFNEQITPNTPYGEPGECYNLCDLEKCQNDAGEKPTLTCWQEEIDAVAAAAAAAQSTTTFPSIANNQTMDPDLTTTSTYTLLTSNGAAYSTLSTEDQVGGSQTTTSSSVSGGSHDDDHSGSRGNSAETSTTTVGSGNDQSTTLPNYGWNSEDEAYYQILQTGDRRERKLTSSGRQQYLEIEPNYLNEGNNNKLEAMDPSSYDATESGNGASLSSSNYQASLQEIYREAMAVTTVDSMMAVGVGNGNEPLNEIELPEEDIAEEWIHVPSNVISGVANQQQQPTTTISSTSAIPPFESFPEQLTGTPPTGTEGSNHYNHNHLKVTSTTSTSTSTSPSFHTSATTTSKTTLMTENHSVESGQLPSKVDGGVNGRQFRHHNSRSKQQQTVEQLNAKGTFSADQHREKLAKVYKEQLVQKKSELEEPNHKQEKQKQLPKVSAFLFQQQSKVALKNDNTNRIVIEDGNTFISSSSTALYLLQFKFLLFGQYVVFFFNF